MSKGPLKLADLRVGKSTFEEAYQEKSIQQNLDKEYNFSRQKQEVIATAIKSYGDVYSAVYEMSAHIDSLKVETESLKEMIDWDDIEDELEEENE